MGLPDCDLFADASELHPFVCSLSSSGTAPCASPPLIKMPSEFPSRSILAPVCGLGRATAFPLYRVGAKDAVKWSSVDGEIDMTGLTFGTGPVPRSLTSAVRRSRVVSCWFTPPKMEDDLRPNETRWWMLRGVILNQIYKTEVSAQQRRAEQSSWSPSISSLYCLDQPFFVPTCNTEISSILGLKPIWHWICILLPGIKTNCIVFTTNKTWCSNKHAHRFPIQPYSKLYILNLSFFPIFPSF